jgi:hypothetical protein
MRRHLKSRFQMLRHKRLNEVIATDTYFAKEKSIEGYHCAQVFFGMTSKMLYVAGMKTESEFADVYLDFIRKYGIPSALRRDNAKSEMSQRVKDIHRDLIIADQWTEPHSPWQNPAELNGIKYLKSHAQVLLDRTGAPDILWFLAQDYLSHVHNLRPRFRTIVYVDADHEHDLVTRRSITGILVMLNSMPIRWISKRQKTVETSTYGSEWVASRIATELILEIRYMHR